MKDQADLSDQAKRTRVSEIRWMALAEILTGATGLDARAYRAEIETLKRRPLSTEWIEANVMLSFIAQVRPSRTTGYLARLRSRAEQEGRTAEFAEFDRRLRAYIAPKVLTNHAFRDGNFSTEDHGAIWAGVTAHMVTLGTLGYEAFLNSGTLLGVVRDGKLIDHDDDVDLAVLLRAADAEAAAREWTDLKGKLREAGALDPEQIDKPQICKLKRIGGVEVDLFPAWQQAGRFYVYPHTHGDLGAADVLPLRPAPHGPFTLPAQPEKMLSVNYGAGWREPDPLFKFPWAEADAKFAPFLERLS